MATMIARSGKRITLTIEEKAKALKAFEINELGKLAVTSGTKPGDAYVVTLTPDGKFAAHCPCKAIGRCAHKVRANWHLADERRNRYVEIFGIYDIA